MREGGGRLDLVVLGNFSLDRLVLPDFGSRERIGGTAYYTSLAAVSLGLRVGVVSNVTPKYRRVVEELLSGVDLSGLNLVGSMTCFEISYTESWDRRMRVLSRGVGLSAEQIPKEFLKAKVFHLGPVFNEVGYELTLKLRRMFKGLLTLDIQGVIRGESGGEMVLRVTDEVKRLVKHVDIVKMGLTEALAFSPDPVKALERMRGYGVETCILTMGERGALLFRGGKVIRVPTVKVKVTDPTGAGDVFMAGLIAWLLRGFDLAEACLRACVFASIFTSRRSFPGAEEVERLARGLSVRCL